MTVEEKVKETITRILRKPEEEIKPELSFKDLNADSLDIVQILVALEDHYDIELMDDDIKSIANFGDFIKYVEKKVTGK
jgi:acyl carrier protein